MGARMAELRLHKFSDGAMTADGEHAVLYFNDNDGNAHELWIAKASLGSVVSQFKETLNRLQRQSAIPSGHTEVQAFETVGFGVLPATGEEKLIVTFRTDRDVDYHFAIPTSEASQFRRDIFSAEKKQKRSGRQTRH